MLKSLCCKFALLCVTSPSRVSQCLYLHFMASLIITVLFIPLLRLLRRKWNTSSSSLLDYSAENKIKCLYVCCAVYVIFWGGKGNIDWCLKCEMKVIYSSNQLLEELLLSYIQFMLQDNDDLTPNCFNFMAITQLYWNQFTSALAFMHLTVWT